MKKPVKMLSLRREVVQRLTRPEMLRLPVGGEAITAQTATGFLYSCGCP
jgi:hypothetical protein